MSDIEHEALGNTEDAGDKVIDRSHALIEQLTEAVNNLTGNVGIIAKHVAHLEAQKAVEGVPHLARVAVNDGMDTVGAGTGLVSKGVDVPLAMSEDVIHDTSEGVKEAGAGVKEAGSIATGRKKLFRKKRK